MSRAPNREFQEWWKQQRDRSLDLSSSSDGPSTSAGDPLISIEIRTPRSDQAVEKSRARSAGQLSWVCLLRFQQITSLVASAASSLVSILRTANRRIAASAADSSSSRLYRIIRFFLILVLALLGFELLAYYKGWHFSPPSVGSKEVLGYVELVYAASSLVSILRTTNRRIAASAADSLSSRLYRIIRFFLILVLALLGFELLAYYEGWHFSPPSVGSKEVLGYVELVYANWLEIRAKYLALPLQSLTNVCIVLFLIQSVDRVVLVLGCLWIKIRGIKPVASIDYEKKGDLESGSGDVVYPMVLVQIPMCNEREVYQQSIAAVCIQDWPRERMLVQVLDDSDDLDVQLLIKSEVQKWQQRGVRIVYRHRLIRTGYKAGNLKSAMSCDYVKDYEFVAIFDADFQPGPDFLKKTIPYFKGNDDLALVQTRWAFVNKDENLLTRLQNINPSFHFDVEQQVNGVFINFFGFNGTAGVWRIKALEECGGWLERTNVEDMDIAVRAHLCGWKFIYLNDVKCLCELPESYEAYKKQQHRWHSGSMQLFRMCFFDVLRSKIPSEEIGLRASSDAGSRKRNVAPKGKAQGSAGTLPSSTDAKVDEDHENSDAKRCEHNESVGNENCSGKAEHGLKGSTGTASEDKPTKTEVKDYIHVRARRGQATDSHSLAERVRREKISERMKILQDLVPGCNKVTGKALMLAEIINYVQSLQRQVESLSMKLASVNTSPDYKVDALMSKEMFQSNGAIQYPILSPDSSAASVLYGHRQHRKNAAVYNNITEGRPTQYPMGPLNELQFPPLDGSNDHVPAIPSEEIGLRASSDAGSRKRKMAPKGKAKGSAGTLPSSTDAKVDEDHENSYANRSKHDESVGNENCSGKAEHGLRGSTGTASEDKQTKTEVKDNIHVRARRGRATDSNSLAERVRREKILERMKILQDLVPGCNKVTGKAGMLDEIINYVQLLQHQVEFLSMKLPSVNTSPDYNVDALMSKEMFQSNGAIQYPILPPDSSAASILYGHRQHQKNAAVYNNITEGTPTQYPMDPLYEPQFPPLEGLNNHVPASFCRDDLQILVQMGFGQEMLTEAAMDHRKNHGQNQISPMKIEL